MNIASSAPRVSLVLFFLLLLLQPVQWYAISKFYEPYPTLTFPVFAGPGKLRNAEHRAWVPTFTAHWESGRVTEVPRGELFADVPEAARWAIIYLNFGPDKFAERDPREEGDLPTSWLPGRRQLWRQIGNPARAREAAPWLAGSPGRNVCRAASGRLDDSMALEKRRGSRAEHVDVHRVSAWVHAAVMTRLTAWLDREYETDAESLAVARVFYALVLLTTGLPRWLWVAELPPSFYQPPLGFASLFSAPPPAWVFYLLNATIIAATVCLLFGLYSQVASIAVAVGLFIGNSFGYAFGKINHDWLLILVPLAGAAAGWGHARGLDASRYRGREVASWPISLVAIAIAFGMLYAGGMKALTGWLSIDHLAVKTVVIENALSNERANAFSASAVDTWPWGLWEAMDWGVVAFECVFIVSALRRRWFLMACATATAFHFANAVMMELQFAFNLSGYALVAHWAAPKWFRPEVVPRAIVTTVAVAVAALYCVSGNPAWLFAQGMGWDASSASQWPFTGTCLRCGSSLARH